MAIQRVRIKCDVEPLMDEIDNLVARLEGKPEDLVELATATLFDLIDEDRIFESEMVEVSASDDGLLFRVRPSAELRSLVHAIGK